MMEIGDEKHTIFRVSNKITEEKDLREDMGNLNLNI